MTGLIAMLPLMMRMVIAIIVIINHSMHNMLMSVRMLTIMMAMHMLNIKDRDYDDDEADDDYDQLNDNDIVTTK
jgi:hypothetical protein